MTKEDLPTDYTKLSSKKRKKVRDLYFELQNGKCMVCGEELHKPPHTTIINSYINIKLFPKGFFNNPIHLQHDHNTNLTEGVVHARCNAYLWQYYMM